LSQSPHGKKRKIFNTIIFCFVVIPGDLENEEEILEWLVDQLEKDEIEDVTDEMLDRLIKDGKTVAVLFCAYLNQFKNTITYIHHIHALSPKG
jgi:hypothetical protein